MCEIEEYIHLKWEILKNKFIYYEAPVTRQGKYIKGISDEEYDKLEERYKALYSRFEKLGEENVTEIVGFPIDTPNGRIAACAVYIENMTESEYDATRKMCLHKFNYDLDVLK